MAEQPLTIEQAQNFVRFALNDEMELRHIVRPKRTYHLWVLKRSGKRLISEKRLARLSVAQFAEYLNGISGYHKRFPDPNVYR